MSDKAVGFFGPYEGMTDAQVTAVKQVLNDVAPDLVHHRSSMGADVQFDQLAVAAGIQREAHPALAHRHHVELPCEVIHEAEAPGLCNSAIAHMSHLLIADMSHFVIEAVIAGEDLPHWVSKPTAIVQPDGSIVWKAPPARLLSAPPTRFENANLIAAEFEKPERIPARLLRLFARTAGGGVAGGRKVLEQASPLFYARLVEAVTRKAKRQVAETTLKKVAPRRVSGEMLHDPTQDKPEFAEAFWVARLMAKHIEDDKYRVTMEHKPERMKEMFRRPSVHHIWRAEAWILREQYGIEWFSPAQMNPFVCID